MLATRRLSTPTRSRQFARFAALGVALGALFFGAFAEAAEIIDPGQGPIDLSRKRSGATGLSGITHLGGDRFLAVSDRGRRLYEVRVRVHAKTGRIASAQIERGAILAGAHDAEGIAYPGGDTVFVCDEAGPALREHRIEDGAVVRALSVPTVYSSARDNMSLESVTVSRSPTGTDLWVANEEALRVDGPKSTQKRGTWVRLQRFRLGSDARPTGQWAYRTDPIPGSPIGGYERSGVVDLVALPDGKLLVLERGLGTRGLRSRIYEVDFSAATETGDIAELSGAAFQPVAKRLLWEARALGDNFEGIALGPALLGGERSLILISDDGAVTLPRLYALRLQMGMSPGDQPAPPAHPSPDSARSGG